MPAAPTPAQRAGSPLVSWAIFEESLDEAEFLWQRRDGILVAHDQTLGDLEIWNEDRLQGAVAGLLVAGEAGLARVLGPGLGSEEPARAAVCAHALLASGLAMGGELFTSAFLQAADARLLSLRRGLELLPDAITALASAARAAPPPAHAAYLEACAFQRRAFGQELGDLLVSRDASVQRAAARLLRFVDGNTRQACQGAALGLNDAEARDLAVESLLIAGLPQARGACRELATAQINASACMLLLLAMLGTADEHKLVLAALGNEARQPAAIWALGFGGRREGADACIDLLTQGRHEKLATEAFCAITGLDLGAAGLLASPPPEADEPISFEDDNLDADLAPKPEERLPMPEISGVVRWWNQQRGRFAEPARYLAGRPFTVELLHHLLLHGPMRRRPALALELAARTQGRVQVETRAWASEQRLQLAAFAALPREVPAASGPPPGRGR
jgi:uncharacterized protein (TIGR02270 family)